MLARRLIAPLISILIGIGTLQGSAEAQSSGASSAKQAKKAASISESGLEPGSVSAGVYRNPMLGISCKIPAGWVLRTEDMSSRDADQSEVKANKDAASGSGQVLLAAFSRPPQARAEDVNSSILIAAESAAAYPGLKDAAQYFGPLSEATKAQGFAAVGDPYEFPVGTKTLPRDDFQKDVGTRVMRQSTLVMLARGYVVSFTFIGGTEDEVEELIGGLTFSASVKVSK
jgi:hypothetical protein